MIFSFWRMWKVRFLSDVLIRFRDLKHFVTQAIFHSRQNEKIANRYPVRTGDRTNSVPLYKLFYCPTAYILVSNTVVHTRVGRPPLVSKHREPREELSSIF